SFLIIAFSSCNFFKKPVEPENKNLFESVKLPPLSDSKPNLNDTIPKINNLKKSIKSGPKTFIVQLDIDSDLPDFTVYSNIIEKKKAFFDFMRPIIINENNKVLKERELVLICLNKKNKGIEPEKIEIIKLKNLAKKYQIKISNDTNCNSFRDILLKVDIIPVELALAQAANESAWGTSYFSTKVNNLFGQWCLRKGCGIVPRNRPGNATHEIAVFDDVSHSVNAYIKNLNTHNAYKKLRLERYKMRLARKKPTGFALAIGLKNYSGIGTEYIKTLKSMIRVNEKYMGLEKEKLIDN
ncbi:MAG: glucosaminidase domain-containing protein, partial [Bacteroidales bacterium]|nr:glucosaminidase domain-containing protein [Bacteroidales bacterium]